MRKKVDKRTNNKNNNKANYLKKYSDEIQAVCSILSILFIGVVSLLISIQNNNLAKMQLELNKSEVKPIITFSYDKNVSSGIDCIKIFNWGEVPLDYDITVISFFNIFCPENSYGTIPIRVYTTTDIYSYITMENDYPKLAEIELYNEKSELLNKIKTGIYDIKSNYTSLSWQVTHTYAIKVTCYDSLNETSTFYYLYDGWDGKLLSTDDGESLFKDMIYCDGTAVLLNEPYLDIFNLTPEQVFEYALLKIREENLYSQSFPEEEIILYGDYEP